MESDMPLLSQFTSEDRKKHEPVQLSEQTAGALNRPLASSTTELFSQSKSSTEQPGRSDRPRRH